MDLQQAENDSNEGSQETNRLSRHETWQPIRLSRRETERRRAYRARRYREVERELLLENISPEEEERRRNVPPELEGDEREVQLGVSRRMRTKIVENVRQLYGDFHAGQFSVFLRNAKTVEDYENCQLLEIAEMMQPLFPKALWCEQQADGSYRAFQGRRGSEVPYLVNGSYTVDSITLSHNLREEPYNHQILPE